MAIKITDNFQVNIKNPIDNRFVVGSQSIPGGPGSIYPTPFYAYRDDISSNMGFVYPGLRIWDFNDNLPYVWTGTTWSNENLTGASVLNSGDPGFSAGNGYRNYVTKFYDTGTVLTKSLLFDNNIHVGLGITSSIDPNKSGGAGVPPLNSSSPSNGLHVSGRIRTNTGFVGYGGYIHSINAQNIDAGPSNTGRLQLPLIATPGVTSPTITYVLTSQINPVTLNIVNSWQNILNVAPLYSPTNLGSGVQLFSGTVGLNHEFFSLVSSGLQIDPGSAGGGSVRIESKPAVNVGGGSASVYKGLNGNKIHEFKTITSDFMNITETSDVINLNSNISSSSLQVGPDGSGHGIKIEIPASFEGTDYYVNNNYPVWQTEPSGTSPGIPNVELGTRSKPFRSLKRCINKILNRPSLADAGGLLGWQNASPDTYDPTINRPNIYDPVSKVSTQNTGVAGSTFKKWEIRTGPGQPKATYLNNYYTSLPGGGAARVIIQSYTQIDENLAINNVTYFLENGGYSSMIAIPDTYVTYNEPGSPQHGQPFEYLFDMSALVISSNPANSVDRGHPKSDYWYVPSDPGNVLGYNFVTRQGVIDYSVNCRLEGSGTIQYGWQHPTRKGFFRTRGTNNYDWTIDQNLNGAGLPPITESEFGLDQYDCELHVGSDAGYISLEMRQLPDSVLGIAPFTHLTTTKTPLVYDTGTILTSGGFVVGLKYQILTVGTTNWTAFGAPSNTAWIIFTCTAGSQTGTGTAMLISPIVREGIEMNGYVTTAVPDYGAIEVEGRNLMFGESLFLAGTVVINCFEQHMIYAKNYGTIYSESGRVYMRRHYQQVLYDKIKWTENNNSFPVIWGMGAGWYKIIAPVVPVGSPTPTNTTPWGTFAEPGTWRNINGNSVAPPTTTSSTGWIGLIFKAKSGTTPTGNGYIAPVTKMYTPSNHVHDIYLKNGAIFNHGGDLYTQQNTGAMQGGACSFVCLENSIPFGGNGIASNPRFPTRNGEQTTYCSFYANGGGFVTNLLYNYYIRHIIHDSYEAQTNYGWGRAHSVSFKSLKIQSQVQRELISCVKSSIAYTSPYPSSPSWGSTWPAGGYSAFGFGPFTSCYFSDYFSSRRMPFSNCIIFNYNVPTTNGRLNVTGTTIDLTTGSFNSGLPIFTGDTNAAPSAPGQPSGAAYIDPITGKPSISIGNMYQDTNGFIKVRKI